jgi:predicted DNA-binding antitoxin AbrB/MazE fold protein
MQKTIEVVYEKGVFKPLEPVELKEGEQLEIIYKESLRRFAGIVKKPRNIKEEELIEVLYD